MNSDSIINTNNSDTIINSNTLIPFVLSFVILFGILILWLILYYSPIDQEKFRDTVTKIMDYNPNVPTINLVKKTHEKNIIQRIMEGTTSSRVLFKINKTKDDNYTINVPNYSDYNFAGKGLVIAAAGNRYRYLTGLYANLYTIRKYHKSNIPIEIFYVGSKEEFSYSLKKLFLDLGNITVYNLLDRINTNCNEDELRGYQTKPLAVLCSSFEEVILVDADALCFIDPQYLFMSEGYENTGMLLFKDYVDCMSFISRDFMETIGIGVDRYCDYTNDYEIDSSCVVMNKKTCWEALYTICIINVKSDSYHKSKNVLGDKDVFLISAMFLGISPHISVPAPKVMITDTNKVIIGHLQSTVFNGQEIFTHYNNQKLMLGDIDVSDYSYAEVKNPKSGQYQTYSTPLTEKILESFKHAKEAMAILDPHIPRYLKDKVKSENGISHGLIP